jgi:hypothetical protein
LALTPFPTLKKVHHDLLCVVFPCYAQKNHTQKTESTILPKAKAASSVTPMLSRATLAKIR